MKSAETKKEVKTIDAAGQTLGRVASRAAVSLLGKDQPGFERNKYSGVPVKIVNASKIRITAKKLATIYHARYSGAPGGLRVISGVETISKKGFRELLKLAIYQMLPDNKLRRAMMKNLEIEE